MSDSIVLVPKAPVATVGNPAEMLPAAARDKLQSLRDDAQDRRAAMMPISDEINDVRLRLAAVDQVIGRHQKVFHPDKAALASEERRRDDLLRELARLQARLEERSKLWSESARVVDRCETFLKSASHLEAAPPVEAPILRKGESGLDALAAIRDKLAKRRDERQAVVDAQVPASVVIEQARSAVEALAERGQPNVMGCIEGGAPFRFAAGALEPVTRGGSGYVQSSIDASALLAWLFKDELVSRIETLIRENADDASALTDAERKSRLEQIDAEILQIERVEEAVIEALHAEGLAVMRRSDCDPRAVLGVEGRAPRA